MAHTCQQPSQPNLTGEAESLSASIVTEIEVESGGQGALKLAVAAQQLANISPYCINAVIDHNPLGKLAWLLNTVAHALDEGSRR